MLKTKDLYIYVFKNLYVQNYWPDICFTSKNRGVPSGKMFLVLIHLGTRISRIGFHDCAEKHTHGLESGSIVSQFSPGTDGETEHKNNIK